VGYGHVGIVHDEGAVIDYGNWIQMTRERGAVRNIPRDCLLGAGAILELPAEGGADRRLAEADVEVSRLPFSKSRIVFWC